MDTQKESKRKGPGRILTSGIICVAVSLVMYFIVRKSAGADIGFFISNLFLITGLILILLGVGIYKELEEMKKALHSELQTVENRFSTLVTKGSIDLADKISDRIKFSQLTREVESLGLLEIDRDCTGYDFSRILTESQQLVVVLNDGRTWASFHRDRLRRRFADLTKQTTFFLCHPNSPMIDVLARKGSTEKETIKSRIMETVALLEEIKQPSTNLEILGHHLFNSCSLFIGDDEVLMIPYFLSRGGRTVPLFRFGDSGESSYMRDIVDDIQRLRMDSNDISTARETDILREVPRLRAH